MPDPANPQSLNRYAYVLNHPLRYTDPSGHVVVPEPWDFDVSNWDAGLVNALVVMVEFLGGQTRLEDNTLTIVPSTVIAMPMATTAEPGRIAAGATGKALVGAACADGDCTNEISILTQLDLPAVKRFAQEAVAVNSGRGMKSLTIWEWLSKSLLQLNDQSRMFIARSGERITGMMHVQYGPEGYIIKHLEGLGGGAGTTLFKQAMLDSMSRGYDGSLMLRPAQQSLEFYARFPGYQILPGGVWFWSAEAAQALLGIR